MDLLDPKSGLFFNLTPLKPLPIIPSWPILLLKVDLLADLGWCITPPHYWLAVEWLHCWDHIFFFLEACCIATRTSLVPMDPAAWSAAAARSAAPRQSRGLATSHTRLAQTVADILFNRPELGLHCNKSCMKILLVNTSFDPEKKSDVKVMWRSSNASPYTIHFLYTYLTNPTLF